MLSKAEHLEQFSRTSNVSPHTPTPNGARVFLTLEDSIAIGVPYGTWISDSLGWHHSVNESMQMHDDEAIIEQLDALWRVDSATKMINCTGSIIQMCVHSGEVVSVPRYSEGLPEGSYLTVELSQEYTKQQMVSAYKGAWAIMTEDGSNAYFYVVDKFGNKRLASPLETPDVSYDAIVIVQRECGGYIYSQGDYRVGYVKVDRNGVAHAVVEVIK